MNAAKVILAALFIIQALGNVNRESRKAGRTAKPSTTVSITLGAAWILAAELAVVAWA